MVATPPPAHYAGTITPPPSIECPTLPSRILRLQPDNLPSPSLSPKTPTSIHDLTPDLIYMLASDRGPKHRVIKCGVEDYIEWIHQYGDRFADLGLDGLWEYDGVSRFIIKCMPSPIHETFTSYACDQITSTIRAATGRSAALSGVQVCPNSEIHVPDAFKHIKRIPDLVTKVRLYPPMPVKYHYGIVFEIGFSQTLTSLRKRASMWLWDLDEESGVHMVILIKVTEIPQEYVNEEGKRVSHAKSQKRKFDWPARIFANSSFEAEFARRGVASFGTEVGMAEPVNVERVLLELKSEIRDRFIQEDRRGRLVPALLEPIDAELYVYRRMVVQEGDERKEDEGNEDKGDERNEEDERNASEINLQRCDLEDSIGMRRNRDVQDYSDVEESTPDSDDSELEPVPSPCSRPQKCQSIFGSDINSSTPSLSDECVEGEDKDGKEEAIESMGEDQDITDAYLRLHLDFSAPILKSSTPTPTPRDLTLLIANLYGPLAIPIPTSPIIISPQLLDRIPPPLRPYAFNEITFEISDMAELLAEQLEQMKTIRATDRAAKVVDREYAKWRKRVEREGEREDAVARVRIGRERERSKREEEVVGNYSTLKNGQY
ncbi:hypothetical protein EV426DRAFT_622394 [Tirmania nivea]|nr:hypothetical protein EV426DRAFT_622394 [Tirmania nivea]